MRRLPGMGRGGRFTRQVALTLFSQVLSLGFALGTSAIVARWLGQEGKGIVTLALLVPGLLVLFLEGGMALANIYFAGSHRFSVAELTQNALTYLLLVMPIGGVVFAVLTITGWLEKLVPAVPLWLLLISVLEFPFRLLVSAFCGVLRGLQRITLVNVVTLVDGLLTLLLTVLLVIILPMGPAGALLASLGAVLVNTLWVSSLVRRYGGRLVPRWNRPVLGATLSYGLRGYAGNILAFFNYRLDMLLVNGYLGPAGVGIYSVSVRFAELLWYLPNATSFVLFPRVAASRPEEARAFTPRVLRATMVLTSIGALFFALLGRPLILWIYSPVFADAYMPLLLLLPGVVLLGGARVLTNAIAGRGQPHYNSLCFGIGFLLTVALDLLLIPRYGVSGASVASSLAYGAIFASSLFFYHRVSQQVPLAGEAAVGSVDPPDSSDRRV
ncbi:MAG: polysaccharide biosynthesis C-terminal domain-containing protein [Chloroflexia bacterium]